MWEALAKWRLDNGLTNRLFLTRRFLTSQMNFSETMEQHINKLNAMVEKFEAIEIKVPLEVKVMVKGQLRSGEVLGLVHCDVWGPTKTTSFGGVRHLKTFINNWSRKTFCYFLQRKGNCFSKFLEGESIVK